MDATPTNDTPRKSTRAKVVVKKPVADKAPRKTLATTRKKSPRTVIIATPKAVADLQGEIQVTAFYLAAERRIKASHSA